MPNQLVGQRPAHSDKDEVPGSVLEHRAMTDFQNMLEICVVATGPRFGITHVAKPTGDLGQILAGNFGVSLPGDAMLVEKSVQLGIIYRLPATKINGRFANDFDVC